MIEARFDGYKKCPLTLVVLQRGIPAQVRRVSFAALVEGSYMPCSEYGHERRMSATYLGTFCTLESLDLGSLTIPSSARS